MQYPLITAHAGCMETIPNTTESVEAGIRNGAHIIEVDLRTTKDGFFVLSHDDELQGINKKLKISQNTYYDLRIEYQGLMLLEEALKLIKNCNRMINLDIKDVTDFSVLYKLINEHQMIDSTIITGYHIEQVYQVSGICQGIKMYVSADEDYLKNPNMDYESYIRKTCSDAMNSGCAGINMYYRDCRKEFVDYATLKALPVCVWTVDHAVDMKKFIQMGVYSITTNQVEQLESIISEDKY